MNTALATVKTRPSLSKNRRGASLVEYALLCFLILAVAAAVWRTVGGKVKTAGEDTGNAFQQG